MVVQRVVVPVEQLAPHTSGRGWNPTLPSGLPTGSLLTTGIRGPHNCRSACVEERQSGRYVLMMAAVSGYDEAN